MNDKTTPWHKSSYSNEHGTCAEVAEGPSTLIRDNQNPHLDVLAFPTRAWADFLCGIRAN